MRRVFSFLLVIALGVTAISLVKQVSVVSSAAAVDAGAAGQEPAALEKSLRDADLEFARQTAARRLEGWMDSFADDASIIHDGATVSGKQALTAYYQPVFANKEFSLSWHPTKAEASKDGTLGYTYGDYEAKSGGAVSRGMYTTVWRRVNASGRLCWTWAALHISKVQKIKRPED
jgi:ketosteroid isomerase-like protein